MAFSGCNVHILVLGFIFVVAIPPRVFFLLAVRSYRKLPTAALL